MLTQIFVHKKSTSAADRLIFRCGRVRGLFLTANNLLGGNFGHLQKLKKRGLLDGHSNHH